MFYWSAASSTPTRWCCMDVTFVTDDLIWMSFQWGVVASVAIHDKAGAERKHYGEHAAANPFCDIICWKEEKWVHWHHGLNIYLIYTFIHYLLWFQTQKHEDFTHFHTKEPLTIAPWRLDQPNGNSPQCVKSYLSN